MQSYTYTAHKAILSVINIYLVARKIYLVTRKHILSGGAFRRHWLILRWQFKKSKIDLSGWVVALSKSWRNAIPPSLFRTINTITYKTPDVNNYFTRFTLFFSNRLLMFGVLSVAALGNWVLVVSQKSQFLTFYTGRRTNLYMK